MSRIRISLTVMMLLFASPSFGQKKGQALIDSLIALVPQTTNDTARVRLYKKVADEYFFLDTDKALYYSKMGLGYVSAMKWDRGLGVFYSYIARAYADKSAYDSCMFYYKKALTIQQRIGDVENICSTLNNMGAAEQNIVSNYPGAIKYYLLSLREAEKLNENYYTANANDNISQIYLGQKNFRKALEYGMKALRLREKQKDTQYTIATRELGHSMSNLGGIYVEMKDSVTAKKYYYKAIELHQKSENKEGLAKTYMNLSTVFGSDLQRKLEYGLKAKKLWDAVNPLHVEAVHNLGNIGICYLDMYRTGFLPKEVGSKTDLLQLSERYLTEAVKLSDKNTNIDYEAHFTGMLAELQALKGDYKSAYLNFRTFQSVQDSLFSQESKNRIAGMEGEREIALRDKQIELNRLALETQKKQRIALLAGVLLLSVIGGLLYWQSRTRKQTNVQLLHLNSELDEANQIKAKFFAILSHDLRSPISNLVNFLHLQKEAPDLISGQALETHQKRITDSAEALLETMEAMLLWSKSQMQQFKPQARPVRVSELFGYIQRFFAGTPEVSFAFDDPFELTVVTDEDYLKTIMQNLTSNAVKALKRTPEASIKWSAWKENGVIVLGIANNGPEVNEEQLHALYSDQASIGIKTGLGLHLIRDLAKAISCKISVFSRSSETVFQLAFAETP